MSEKCLEELFISKALTEPGRFTAFIEGPCCDRGGTLYATNYGELVDGTEIDSATLEERFKKGLPFDDCRMSLGKVTPEGQCSAFVDLPRGSIAGGIRFNSEGVMLVADCTQHNILKIDMGTKEIGVYAHESRMNQPNDIAIGANDILYASDPNWKEGTGQIWRVDTDGTVTLLETGMGTTNGIEVSPDERTLYVNETIQRNVWAYDLSPEGKISNKRLLIQFPDFGLDGMRCDVEGNLHIARFGKGVVAKVSPEGEVLLEVAVSGKNPSNIAFGGSDGRTCYVTLLGQGSVDVFRADRPGRSWRLYQERRT